MTPPRSVIATFATHRVAANLFMFLFILAGVWALKNLNTQTFPQFDLDYISIAVLWSGASAEDVERSIVVPIEQELKSLTEIRKITSTSYAGSATVLLELDEGSDIGTIQNKVKQIVEAIRNLPQEAERPLIRQVEALQPIANFVITGSESRPELAQLAYQFERQLLALGIRKIDFAGLPKEEIAIQVSSNTLHETGLSLNQIASLVQQNSTDLPAGTAAKSEVSKEIRSLSQQRDTQGFEQLPLITDKSGRMLRVGDIATVEQRPLEDEPWLTWRGLPAIEMQLQRTEDEDTLKTAEIFNRWVEQTIPLLPHGIELHVYNERWRHLDDRIHLLLSNGIGGMILVIATLLLFLNVRVAFWVALGIPVSFLASLAVLHLIGGSINMISLFGLIMALGIIVDDAIVVGEDTLTHWEQGEGAERSAIGGARRMFAPVMASSLTTIAAFLPLSMLGGTMGKLAIEIPQLIICVIIASLVECFLILPGHLNHSLRSFHKHKTSRFKAGFDRSFDAFREQKLKPAVEFAIRQRASVVIAGFAAFVIAISLWASGNLKFTFFPAIDGNDIRANAEFHPGTPPQQVKDFLAQLDHSLTETRKQMLDRYDSDPVKEAVTYHGRSFFGLGAREIAPERGAIVVDLRSGERPFTNAEFMAAWRDNISLPPGLNKLTIVQREAGPPGKAIAIKLLGGDAQQLKAASLELQHSLMRYNGVSNIDDNLPWGKEQLIYQLTPTGRRLGLDTVYVGRQLRAAFDGVIAQVFNLGQDEIEVRVTLPDAERNLNRTLEQFPLILPDGQSVPLSEVVNFVSRKGFDQLNHTNGELNVVVSADLDVRFGNANEIYADLFSTILPDLRHRYRLKIALEGRAQDQAETIEDMKVGLVIGLALIYIVLAWIFSSYSWPIAVMTAIPLGLTGALIGHFFMGKELSMFSMMGLFGLSGIVVNDSIVLITFYGELRAKGKSVHDAIVESICSRFRAVILTSLTTVAGLLPIMFETSLQAQFLIPMAISMVFGLSYATLLVLFFVPALLTYIESAKVRIENGLLRLNSGSGREPANAATTLASTASAAGDHNADT